MKGKPFVADGPLCGQIKKLPLSAALIAAVVVAVLLLPFRQGAGRIPYDLGIRTHQQILSPALQLFAAGAVNNLIILPIVSKPHR